MTRIHKDLERISAAITALRAAKASADSEYAKLSDGDARTALQAYAGDTDTVMNQLFQPQATKDEDVLRYPIHVYEQLSTLGALAGSPDAAPTAAQRNMLSYLETEMNAALAQSSALLGPQRTQLDARLKRDGAPPL